MASTLSNKFQNPIFVALDMDDAQAALDLSTRLKGKVGGFKLGPRLLLPYGATLVPRMRELGHVFVDNKYFDIPQTMASAVQAAFTLGATLVTVHAQAGAEALRVCAQREAEARARDPLARILAVTVLTSFSADTLPPTMRSGTILQHVETLVRLGLQSGIQGFVCASHEASSVRNLAPKALIVTPGIRRPGEATHDQVRTTDPLAAMQAGADVLVIGRSILQAPDPLRVVQEISDALQIS